MSRKGLVFSVITVYILLMLLIQYYQFGDYDDRPSLLNSRANNTRPKLICIILSTQDDLKSSRAFTTIDAWAYKCTKYLLIFRFDAELQKRTKLIKVNDDIGFEAEEPLNFIHPAGLSKDSYKSLNEKMFFTLRHIYFKYGNQFDWFLKADLDTFIHVENLNLFLKDKDPYIPTTYGFDFKLKGGYQSGGAGYVLSKKAMQFIGESLLRSMSFCNVSTDEDVDVHNCLRKLGANMSSSLDENGRERFHFTDPTRHFLGNFTTGELEYIKNQIHTVNFRPI